MIKSTFSLVVTLALTSSISMQALATDTAPHPKTLTLRSSAALIIDQKASKKIFSKAQNKQMAIASITKLMTAMVVLNTAQRHDEKLTITSQDIDRLRYSSSRLPVGSILTRGELLQVMLMSSENRAASALARSYVMGKKAFIRRMNQTAKLHGMFKTKFVDATGLSQNNVSTASDLTKLVWAAIRYPLIRRITTTPSSRISFNKSKNTVFNNTNRLLKNKNWTIGVSKTGYIRESGRCLVIQTLVSKRPYIVILLNSHGRDTHFADARRIRKWLLQDQAIASTEQPVSKLIATSL